MAAAPRPRVASSLPTMCRPYSRCVLFQQLHLLVLCCLPAGPGGPITTRDPASWLLAGALLPLSFSLCSQALDMRTPAAALGQQAQGRAAAAATTVQRAQGPGLSRFSFGTAGNSLLDLDR